MSFKAQARQTRLEWMSQKTWRSKAVVHIATAGAIETGLLHSKHHIGLINLSVRSFLATRLHQIIRLNVSRPAAVGRR